MRLKLNCSEKVVFFFAPDFLDFLAKRGDSSPEFCKFHEHKLKILRSQSIHTIQVLINLFELNNKSGFDCLAIRKKNSFFCVC